MQTLQNFYSDTYAPLALRARRPNTRRLYATTLRAFDRFLGRSAKLADLNDCTVSQFAQARVLQGLSLYSVNRDLFNLLAMWRWAHRKAYVTNWPDVQLERPPKRAPVAMLREELDELIASIRRQTGEVSGVAARDWWLALVLLAWDTGERISPLLALEWECVDLRRGWVRFPAESRKGGREDNQLRVAADTVEALKRLGTRRGKVFKWPRHPTTIYHAFGKIMVDAGMPDDHLHKFHCLRKSVASHYEAAGGNATQLLGHSSRKITESYLDLRIVNPKPAIDLLFRPGQPR